MRALAVGQLKYAQARPPVEHSLAIRAGDGDAHVQPHVVDADRAATVGAAAVVMPKLRGDFLAYP